MSTTVGLSYGTELRRQWRRRPIKLALAFMLALPLAILVGHSFGGEATALSGPRSQISDLSATAVVGGLNFAVFTLFVSGWMPIATVFALFGGDAVAGEAQDGTLRYLLAVPVPRGRLLTIKLGAAVTWSFVSVISLTAGALAVGSAKYGWGPLRSSISGDIAAGPALGRLAAVSAYLIVSTLAVVGLAFLLSVVTDSALAATGGATVAFVISSIIDQTPLPLAARGLLPTHYGDAWLGLLSEPMHTEMALRGAVLSLAYATAAAGAAWWWFLRKDIVR